MLRSVKESSTSSIKDAARREKEENGESEREPQTGSQKCCDVIIHGLWCCFSKLTSLLFNSVYCHRETPSAKRAHHSVISVNQALEWMFLHLACFSLS